jgi:hypothetical protein
MGPPGLPGAAVSVDSFLYFLMNNLFFYFQRVLPALLVNPDFQVQLASLDAK